MGWTDPKTWVANIILTAAELNTHVRDNLNYLKKNTDWGAPEELTINAGVVAATQSYHTLDTEGDAASDDLDTISGVPVGKLITVRAAHEDRTIVLKDGIGNLILGTDISLDNTNKHVMLISDGTNLHPVWAT